MWGSLPLMIVSTTVIIVLHSIEVVHIPHESRSSLIAGYPLYKRVPLHTSRVCAKTSLQGCSMIFPSFRRTHWGYTGGVSPDLSYLVFTPKPSTHHMHDPGSIIPHIWPKGFTDKQLSWIKYDYYYINSVSKDYDDSQWNETVEDSITPQEWQPGQHVAKNSSSKNSSPSSPSEQ
jgi:hypothetical protein